MPDTGWPNHPGPQCDCSRCAYQRAYARPQPIQPNQVPNAFMSGFGGCLGVGVAILVVIAVVIGLAVGCAAYATHSNQNNNSQSSSAATPTPSPSASFVAMPAWYPDWSSQPPTGSSGVPDVPGADAWTLLSCDTGDGCVTPGWAEAGPDDSTCGPLYDSGTAQVCATASEP